MYCSEVALPPSLALFSLLLAPVSLRLLGALLLLALFSPLLAPASLLPVDVVAQRLFLPSLVENCFQQIIKWPRMQVNGAKRSPSNTWNQLLGECAPECLPAYSHCGSSCWSERREVGNRSRIIYIADGISHVMSTSIAS